VKIEKLEIRSFGKLNNLTLNFSKGLNIVYGKNESGKTTIQWFIKGMLFGLKGGKGSKEGVPPPIKKFKPWLANEFTGFLEYKLDSGEFYRIDRNFTNNSTRIFDSLFNDITLSFEISKEKGVAFSEKHLGLNEACFDRTVFIRQMESIIDDDGSKELLNRLINVSQTGFEDVSFKKAHDILKEALKSHIGTDKTTTRPLDKIVNRLDELKSKKNTLVSKRESMFSLEEQLNLAYTLKNNLEN
jgi:DNA repair exonuclease SbcCD ATPase subunit